MWRMRTLFKKLNNMWWRVGVNLMETWRVTQSMRAISPMVLWRSPASALLLLLVVDLRLLQILMKMKIPTMIIWIWLSLALGFLHHLMYVLTIHISTSHLIIV
jgi:hypothetical protein